MKLCIYEDDSYRNLLPLVWLRPVYFLKCGITDLAEKIMSAFPGLKPVYHCRDYLADVVKESSGIPINEIEADSCLFVNGRVLFDPALSGIIDLSRADTAYCAGEEVVAVALSPEKAASVTENPGALLQFSGLVKELPVIQVDATVVTYLWEVVSANAAQIEHDFSRLCPEPEIKSTLHDGVHLVNTEKIHIAENVSVMPGVVIDAESGPVLIDSGAKIMANAVIEGPAYIGPRSVVKIGAKIYGGTAVGEVCKVGGEIESSIIHSFSNKQHDGFLGHAYLGQWINLGADTNNSDLKNNYKSVRVSVGGREIDTGRTFVGLFMGDHSKTGINTMFPTGCVVGIHCNLFGGGFMRKNIPSYSWGGNDNMIEYDLEKALETAEIVMKRRNRELSDALQRLMRLSYDKTRD
ncbi:putative sugar nucleotidyl transferase [candidate division KSB1 bacterium]